VYTYVSMTFIYMTHICITSYHYYRWFVWCFVPTSATFLLLLFLTGHLVFSPKVSEFFSFLLCRFVVILQVIRVASWRRRYIYIYICIYTYMNSCMHTYTSMTFIYMTYKYITVYYYIIMYHYFGVPSQRHRFFSTSFS